MATAYALDPVLIRWVGPAPVDGAVAHRGDGVVYLVTPPDGPTPTRIHAWERDLGILGSIDARTGRESRVWVNEARPSQFALMDVERRTALFVDASGQVLYQHDRFATGWEIEFSEDGSTLCIEDRVLDTETPRLPSPSR